MSTTPAHTSNDPTFDRFQKRADLWERHIHAFVDIQPNYDGTGPKGPLSGLTVGVKDIIDVAGLPTRNGSHACTHAAPALADAACVAALRDAGAMIVGKTTTTEFAFTDPTACRNPFDVNRTPGGSSSGSGAAVAAGLVDIALGTQTAGSLCRPAAYCGVVGFKPTYGVLPTSGVTPLAPSFDSVGVIAGSVTLAERAFMAMAPSARQTPETAAPRVVSGLWATKVTATDDTLTALHAAASACADANMLCHDLALPTDIEPIVAAHRTVMQHEAALAHGAMLSDGRAHALQSKFLTGLRAGAAISPDAAAQAAAFLARAKDAFWVGLDNVDAVLTLPVPDGAPLVDGTTGYQDWLTPWTVFGGPLICLPWGVDRLGRPRSVMLAARPGQDVQLLSIASRLEACAPPCPRPSPPKPP
jgi:Asp-tRNA(Asn)/Glu-tRNA(Gln) amidotransferase A subunit family amidase